MPEDFKHRWVMLNKHIAEQLVVIDPDYWKPFLRQDGKILAELNSLMYGIKEAAHYWNIMLIDVFLRNGYVRCAKDKCVLVKRVDDKVSICGITVDDCQFVCTKDDDWIEDQIKMLRDAFNEITVERGDEIGIIGMTAKFNREAKSVSISQKKYAESVKRAFGVTRGAPTPALGDVFGEATNQALLSDQRDFMSKNALLMFGSTRSYPETKPTVTRLSSEYNKATEGDMAKARRVAEYIVGSIESHCLTLSPKSLQLIASSDASYAEHVDGKSHTGGCVGFESDSGCWFIHVSTKQPVVAKSSCEAELIAVNKVGDHVEWAIQLMEELGYPQGPVTIEQDNTCAMEIARQGTGSFKRAKHIKVRFFWLKQLMDEGTVVLKYIPTADLVADIMTKPLVGQRFKYLVAKLLGNKEHVK